MAAVATFTRQVKRNIFPKPPGSSIFILVEAVNCSF
jgi:hypothetical protein